MSKTKTLAPLLARHVEYSAELARQHAFAIPRQYELGVAIDEDSYDGEGIVLHLRLNDLRFTRRWLLDDRDDLGRIGAEVVSRYLDAHPELLDHDRVDAVKARLRGARFEDEVDAAARKAARKSIYDAR